LRWVSAVGLFVPLASGASCLSRGDAPFQRQSQRDDGGLMSPVTLDGSADAKTELPPVLPHAVLGVDPPHGPFSGGALAMIRGNGFDSEARVWFGSVEVAEDQIVGVDPQRLQVTVPAGTPGATDVSVQNGDDESTRASLSGGYTYDAFFADPSSGPTSGGTLVTLHGQGTSWDADTEVEIDLEPCVVVELVSETELVCRTPPGTQGAKPIRVSTADGIDVDVLDGFTYGNSDNGYRGGLSGDPLGSEIKVLAFNDFSGDAIPGVTVILGGDATLGPKALTNQDGVALISSPDLGSKQTVTLAKECFQPVTFVDVPVDTLTVYLSPVLSPACGAGGELPPSGGNPGQGSTISGEVVWDPTGEFQRQGWTNVPQPQADSEKEVAYVFRLASKPTDVFSLPSAIDAITPSDTGSRGYTFSMTSAPGNFTLYVLAGLEDRSKAPPTFTAYEMGLLRGVAVKPGQTNDEVYLPVNVPLDHTLTLEMTAPTVTERGPDRLEASLAIHVENNGYALLPSGRQLRQLPTGNEINFVGVPPLIDSLAGTEYIVTARAYTGAAMGLPLSAVGLLSTTTTSQPILIEGFVQIPALEAPAANSLWNGQDLSISMLPGGAEVDVMVVDVQSGSGLISWQIVAPGSARDLSLPDLEELGEAAGLIHGPISVQISAAHIRNFSYGALRYRDLGEAGWTAYATDIFLANY
jgi:IPT/TIG domain